MMNSKSLLPPQPKKKVHAYKLGKTPSPSLKELIYNQKKSSTLAGRPSTAPPPLSPPSPSLPPPTTLLPPWVLSRPEFAPLHSSPIESVARQNALHTAHLRELRAATSYSAESLRFNVDDGTFGSSVGGGGREGNPCSSTRRGS